MKILDYLCMYDYVCMYNLFIYIYTSLNIYTLYLHIYIYTTHIILYTIYIYNMYHVCICRYYIYRYVHMIYSDIHGFSWRFHGVFGWCVPMCWAQWSVYCEASAQSCWFDPKEIGGSRSCTHLTSKWAKVPLAMSTRQEQFYEFWKWISGDSEFCHHTAPDRS